MVVLSIMEHLTNATRQKHITQIIFFNLKNYKIYKNIYQSKQIGI